MPRPLDARAASLPAPGVLTVPLTRPPGPAKRPPGRASYSVPALALRSSRARWTRALRPCLRLAS